MKTHAVKRVVAVSAAAILAGSLAACSSGGDSSSSGGSTTITYAMWDPDQAPVYQKCADEFAKKTGITVKIKRVDYGSYWKKLTSDFVAGTGPDVFVNVTSFVPQYAKEKQLVDLAPLVKKDDIDLSKYQPSAIKAWDKNGHIYGLPKDVDAIGYVYDANTLEKAGIDPSQLSSLTWNPKDGGTFGKVIKELTLDVNGRNGLDPAFDHAHIKRYGIAAPVPDDPYGHQDWGNLAMSSGAPLLVSAKGWKYDTEQNVQTLRWYQKMTKEGYMMPAVLKGVGTRALFESGKVASAMAGSWNASNFAASKVPLKWVRQPSSSAGLKSYSNSIADTISAGSKHQDEAWKWVKYLGTPACQDVVASAGVVFPSLKSSFSKAEAGYAKKGIDLKAIVDTIETKDAAIPLPVNQDFQKVTQLAVPAMEDIFINHADPQNTLTKLDQQIAAIGK